MKKVSKNSFTKHFKDFLCLLIFSMFSTFVFSQNAGISASGVVPPNASAGLDVDFATKGLLLPRVALAATIDFAPLTAHIAGMVVYNTVTAGDVTPGIYYNDGIKWIEGFPKATINGEMQYWDGTTWKTIPAGLPGNFLKINSSGIPTWAP